MTRADWEEAVARAIIERSFRARLLADPADTLSDYGLCATERTLIEGLRPLTLEQLTALMRRRLPRLRSPFGEPLALDW